MSSVSMQPTTSPALLTAEEFLQQYGHARAELVKGIVKESSMPSLKHGKTCGTITALLWNHIATGDLGHVMSNDSWIRTRTGPDTVRGPDVCYFSYERLPKGEVPEGLLAAVPDLVIEVRSASDRWNTIFARISEYLDIGVRVVLVLDPASASASVYRADELQQIFHNGDEMSLPDVLPGFTVQVSRLFA